MKNQKIIRISEQKFNKKSSKSSKKFKKGLDFQSFFFIFSKLEN